MRKKKGIFPDHMLRQFMKDGHIQGADKKAIGPSSLDLTLSGTIYEVAGTATPHFGEPVKEMAKTIPTSSHGLREHHLNAEEVYVLKKGSVYVAELNESLDLPKDIQGRASPRSRVGRMDIFVRVLANGVASYDTIPTGYKGKLYLDIFSSEFDIEARKGCALSQLRLHRGDIQELTLKPHQLRRLTERKPYLLVNKNSDPIEDPIIEGTGLLLRVDLQNKPPAYKVKHVIRSIDILADGVYDAEDFWEVVSMEGSFLTLDKEDFYIMKSMEHLVVPPKYAVEIVPHNERLVEARIHYAGFAHPGFGYTKDGGIHGTPLIFEVRARDAPIALRHGKPLAKLFYMRMCEEPETPYNKKAGVAFRTQGLELPPCFKPWGAASR